MIALPGTIGPYRILQSIGQGGMGVVYRAEHPETGAHVALKTVRIPHQRMLASIRREIHALSRVRHPGVVRIMDQGAEGARPWYAMELLEGVSLELYLRDLWASAALDAVKTNTHGTDAATLVSFEPFSDVVPSGPGTGVGRERTLRPPGMPSVAAAGGRLGEVLTVFAKLCETLAYIHGEGIVHRDLKPGNVLIRPDGTPVLVDFGLVSRSLGAPGREFLDAEGRSLAGTPEYMSPEQILGEWTDARSDLYALGCMLYEAITGALPFQGANAAQIFERQLLTDPSPPSTMVSGLPLALDALVLRMLAKRPRARPGHADDVARALASLGADYASERTERPRAYLYRAELQGRDAAMEQFREWMQQARDGRGRCVLLGGDSGAGKTYLAMEVVRLAHEQGFRTVANECVPPDASTPRGVGMGAPLACFARLLNTVADRCSEEGPEATQRLLGARGPVLAALDPALGHVPGLEGFSPPPELPPEAAQDRLLAALGDTLAALSNEEPVLLTLDDAHWADELSLRFLASLPERVLASHRILVLVIHRTDDAGERLSTLASAPGVARVDLTGLDREDVGALVGSMLALPEAPGGFVEFLTRRSGGNPFFVAEYLRAAVDAGVLHRDAAGHWIVAAHDEVTSSYDALDLPISLHALVLRRLETLSDGADRACRAAATLGVGFDTTLLAAAAGASEPECMESVRELLTRALIEEFEPGRYRFVQGQYREIAYERIPHAARPLLHRAAGEALAARYDGAPGLSTPYPELAHHFRLAGNPPRAVGYLARAGEQALRAWANREAVRYLTEALTLAREAGVSIEPTREGCWERQLGEALLGLGELRESRVHLENALRLLDLPRPGNNGALAGDLLAQMARQVRTRVGLGVRARATPTATLEAARAYDKLNQGFFHTGEPLPIFHATVAILNLTEAVGPSPELVMAYANAHGAASLIPLRGLAQTYARAAESALAQAPDPVAESWLCVMTGMSALASAEWSLARTKLERAAAIAEKLGFRRRWEEAAGTIAGMHFLRGEFEASLAMVRRYADSVARGDLQGRVWALQGLAQHHARVGELDRAEGLLVEVRALTAHDANLATGYDWGMSDLLRRRGDLAGAAAAADRAAAAYAKRPPLAYFELHGLDAIARARLDAWAHARRHGARDAAACEKKVKASLQALERYARPFAIAGPSLLLRRGQYHAIRGDISKALLLYPRAIELAATLAMPYHRALAEQAYAALLAPADPKRAGAIARAASFFEAAGAVMDHRETLAL